MEVRGPVLRPGACRACVRPPSRSAGLSPPDVLSVAAAVARALEQAGIEYFLGGSLASSHQGEPRATNDVDFVVAMSAPDAAPLAERKLLWYREGGGVSERLWRDVIGVLRHSATMLDSSYLDRWARKLALDDLLGKARGEAAEP